jgi:transposase
MSTMADSEARVIGGVDTHRDTHTGAAVNELGAVFGTEMFPATPAGYRRLLSWLESFGPLGPVDVEGTGSYGAGLSRHLQTEGVEVREVIRPNRQARRRYGKSDPADAIAAARAVLSGEAEGHPRGGNGPVESIRVLKIARNSAVKQRTQVSALVTTTAPPALLAEVGVGINIAADLLITIGDNPHRIRNEASFAALCGTSPVDASSGLQQRHRLNRGGDRQANAAMHRAIIVRLRYHQPTRQYMTRRLAQGKTKKEIIRCLKRALARQIYHHITHPPTTT